MNKKERSNNQSAETARHSLAHILAYAITELYPGTKLGMGPAIENGFYYDFDFTALNISLAPEALLKIEKRMREILKQRLDFEKADISVFEAKEMFRDQPFKFELIEDLEKQGNGAVSVYKTGKFTDLCSGPHVKTTRDLVVDGFKLQRLAGAYWKGDEKNQMLTRIYGVAFNSQKELADYLEKEKEAQNRDHRKLGSQLDLFVYSDLVGKGLPMFTEKGSIIRRELENFIVAEEIKRGYKHVYTPELAKVDLYRMSGHYPYYKDTMYPVMKVDEEELILRPMSCPHHYQLYSSKPRSYRELPFRIAELAKLYRYEKSGELSGLVRVRQFCLADGHIICTKEQAVKEIGGALDLIEFAAKTLGLKKGVDYQYRLSLGDRNDEKKYAKDDASWDFAENLLRGVLKKRKASFYEAQKEAAFYGPKIDIQMKNISGKEETAFTVQYDFVGPKRFSLAYIDKDGSKQEPIVIHRSSIGCIERIMAFLIERYAGILPLWLAPIQVALIPIGKTHQKYAKELAKDLNEHSFRVLLMDENDSVGKKIREGETQKIPYLLILGDKEIKSKSVSVRRCGKGDIGTMKFKKFLKDLGLLLQEKK